MINKNIYKKDYNIKVEKFKKAKLAIGFYTLVSLKNSAMSPSQLRDFTKPIANKVLLYFDSSYPYFNI